MYKELELVRDRNAEIAYNLKHKCNDTKVKPLPERLRATRGFFTQSLMKKGDQG